MATRNQKINALIESRKRSIKVIEVGIIKPLKDAIDILQKVKRGEASLENAIKLNEIVSERHTKIFGGDK